MSAGRTLPMLSNVLDDDMGRYLQNESDDVLMYNDDDVLRAPGVHVVTNRRDYPVEYQIAHDQVGFRPPCMRIRSCFESLMMAEGLTWRY